MNPYSNIKVFNATFNNISVILWWSVLLVEETGGPGENHRPAANHWQTLSHNVVSSTPRNAGFELTTLVVVGIDSISSCKSNHHMITTTTPTSNIRKISASKGQEFNGDIILYYVHKSMSIIMKIYHITQTLRVFNKKIIYILIEYHPTISLNTLLHHSKPHRCCNG